MPFHRIKVGASQSTWSSSFQSIPWILPKRWLWMTRMPCWMPWSLAFLFLMPVLPFNRTTWLFGTWEKESWLVLSSKFISIVICMSTHVSMHVSRYMSCINLFFIFTFYLSHSLDHLTWNSPMLYGKKSWNWHLKSYKARQSPIPHGIIDDGYWRINRAQTMHENSIC